MELLLFFLKVWSIMWTIVIIILLTAIIIKRPDKMKLDINLRTCFEWTMYITSLYSWTI